MRLDDVDESIEYRSSQVEPKHTLQIYFTVHALLLDGSFQPMVVLLVVSVQDFLRKPQLFKRSWPIQKYQHSHIYRERYTYTVSAQPFPKIECRLGLSREEEQVNWKTHHIITSIQNNTRTTNSSIQPMMTSQQTPFRMDWIDEIESNISSIAIPPQIRHFFNVAARVVQAVKVGIGLGHELDHTGQAFCDTATRKNEMRG